MDVATFIPYQFARHPSTYVIFHASIKFNFRCDLSPFTVC